jgi:carboxylesterase type B
MTSHTSNESIPFVPTTIATSDDLTAYVLQALPAASAETVNYLLDTLYPDVLDGTYPWYSEFGRAAQMATDLNFACTTNYLAKAYNNETHNYVFAYPPGYHASDLAYTFFNGDTVTLNDGLAVNATLAYELQDYIMQFVKSGDPNVAGATNFPEYGSEGLALQFTYTGLAVDVDSMNNARCAWIQQAMVNGMLT